jgi:lactate 2-monooxygenase
MSTPTSLSTERQLAIYREGSLVPVSAEALEAGARAALAREPFDYLAGGAGAENTMRANLAAFDRWRIVPRVLRDVSHRNWKMSLLGHELPAPVLLAPIGVQGGALPSGRRGRHGARRHKRRRAVDCE